MAEVVGGLLMPHDPLLFTAPELGPKVDYERVMEAFEAAQEHLARLDPTIVVVFGSDHYSIFGPSCLPQVLVGVGEVETPLERLPGLPREACRTAPRFARHLHTTASRLGMDWAVSKSMVADHAIGIPFHKVIKPADLAVVPIYLASGVEPFLPLKRAAHVGQAVRTAAESWLPDDRVAIIGSGGISHWVGTSDMGRVDEDFDRWVIDACLGGRSGELCALTDDEILRRGGNGAMEIRQFVAALEAVAGHGELIDYIPSPEWITGLGFVALTAGPDREMEK